MLALPFVTAEQRERDLYGEPEDTRETGLGRLPFLGWLRRTSRGLGRARSWFLPLAHLALLGLAVFFGWRWFAQLAGWLGGAAVRAFEASAAWLAGVFGAAAPAGDGFFAARLWLGEALPALWGPLLVLWTVWLCRPLERDPEDLGYVVPGSGRLARSWAVVGRQLYRLRVGLREGFFYLRDLNLEKLVLPPALVVLLVLGLLGLRQSVDNLLFELHLLAPGLVPAGAWIAPVAWGTAAVCLLVLGPPLLGAGLRRLQLRARRRRERGLRLVWRLLCGWAVLLLIALPAAWMAVGWLAG